MIDDETLIAALRLAAGGDPIPAHVAETARRAHALRVPGAVLARPTSVPRPGGVRTATAPRLLRFVTPGLTVDVEFSLSGGLVDLAGRITPNPGEGGEVLIRTPYLSEPRHLSVSGQFAATALPPGWFSLVIDRSPAPRVVTSWTRVKP